ncbi:hypothetical protein CGLO_00280 [Colletotrichum gloeosporioides Cg-14]|uniref:Uncharacterized protein n=1 Tax=Colletotrichum gloeosporioides (strain Cg-14) TaxID=1237896 RepID=T0KUX9_COLGC|nr:hypothetical protein CGLO_00280 [Colletotrichum gloeosporioides Cg-14]
MEQLRLLLD